MMLTLEEIGLSFMTLKKSNPINKLTHLELSIQFSLSGLSFCILNRDTNTVFALREINFDKKLNPIELLDQIRHLFNTDDALQNSFSRVLVIHDNELSTLVPKPLFHEDNLADYLKFNSKILKSDFITFDEVTVNDSVNVYVPYININNFIYDKFGTFIFKHLSSILIEQVLLIEKNSHKPKMYVNLNNNHFEMIVVNKTKFIFYNRFNYNTKEDFIYYILFTAEQLKLNPETLNLVLIGNIDVKDELYTIAYKYIRFVFLGDRDDHYKYNNAAQPSSNHSNFALIKSF